MHIRRCIYTYIHSPIYIYPWMHVCRCINVHSIRSYTEYACQPCIGHYFLHSPLIMCHISHTRGTIIHSIFRINHVSSLRYITYTIHHITLYHAHYIISYIASYISNHIISHHTSYYIYHMLHHATLYHIASYHITSHRITSYVVQTGRFEGHSMLNRQSHQPFSVGAL